jgi:hypothetical protein
MNSAEIEALFSQTLLGDYEGEAPWAAVSTLQQDGSREIFERAAAWCLSDDPIKRARGATILCQLRRAPIGNATSERPDLNPPEWMFRVESFALITKMLESENDPIVLEAALHALGHLGNIDAIPVIVRHQGHPEDSVRFAVSFALGCFPNDSQSVGALLRLMSDPNAQVRDWACFGLGVLGDADSAEIREGLIRCLDDEDEDVREEAAVGLGRRRDQRLIPRLWKMLDEPELKIRTAEAAAALLGFEQDPPERIAADYKVALRSKFQISE